MHSFLKTTCAFDALLLRVCCDWSLTEKPKFNLNITKHARTAATLHISASVEWKGKFCTFVRFQTRRVSIKKRSSTSPVYNALHMNIALEWFWYFQDTPYAILEIESQKMPSKRKEAKRKWKKGGKTKECVHKRHGQIKLMQWSASLRSLKRW